MRERLMARPVVTVVVLEVVYDALVIVGALALSRLLPALPGYSVREPSQSLVLVLLSAVVLLAIVAAFRWWSLAGLASRARELRLYWLPVLLLVVPFVGGIRPLPWSSVGLLAIAYLATAVFEEGLWRGVMVGLLRPTGVWKAVLVSSLLFGLGHLGNSVLRGFSPLIAAQAFGAGVQGIGFAALRLRTNTIWPLIALHAVHDFFLQLSALPIPLVEVPVDTITAVYGIVLLRRSRGDTSVEGGGEPDSPAAGAPASTR